MFDIPAHLQERRRTGWEPAPGRGRRSRDDLRIAQARLQAIEERLTRCLECEDDEQSDKEDRPYGPEWYC